MEGREDARHLLAGDAAEVRDLTAFAARSGKGIQRRSHGGRTRLRATGPEVVGPHAAKPGGRDPAAVGEGPPAVDQRPEGSGGGQQQAGRGDGAEVMRAEDEQGRAGAGARAEREDAEDRDTDEDRGGVEDRHVDAAGPQHDKVAQDLGDHRQQDDGRHPPARPAVPQHCQPREPAAQPAAQPHATDGERDPHHDRQQDHRNPPWPAQRPDEREGHGHGEDELGEQNRHFGGGESAELGRGVGGAALQRGDAHGKADLAVDEVADVADARGAEEHPPAHRPTGRVHAAVPRLAARQQRTELQQRRGQERPERRTDQRVLDRPPPAPDRHRDDSEPCRSADSGQRGTLAVMHRRRGIRLGHWTGDRTGPPCHGRRPEKDPLHPA